MNLLTNARDTYKEANAKRREEKRREEKKNEAYRTGKIGGDTPTSSSNVK